MTFPLEIREEIKELASWIDPIIPHDIKRAISLAAQDLYSGPVYLDAAGEPCDCFDDGATQFDFKAACETIRDWLDSNVSDIKIEVFYDEEEDASEYDSVEGTAQEICKELLGKELFKMIYQGHEHGKGEPKRRDSCLSSARIGDDIDSRGNALG